MAEIDSDDDVLDAGLFREPASFRPASPPPTFTSYALQDGRVLNLRLVGHNPLWGHHLWNGGRVVAKYLEERAPSLVHGRTVLELGAGAALPSLVAALCGAAEVIASDYPDEELVKNMDWNIAHALHQAKDEDPRPESGDQSGMQVATALGYLWGAPLPLQMQPENKFNLLILADVVFNHSEHGKLADTVARTLSRDVDAVALVFFTPYRPWLLEKDFDFFRVVQERGLLAVEILRQKMDSVMFEKDPGDEELRRTVFGYELRWPIAA